VTTASAAALARERTFMLRSGIGIG
jgi:hypothetical protein